MAAVLYVKYWSLAEETRSGTIHVYLPACFTFHAGFSRVGYCLKIANPGICNDSFRSPVVTFVDVHRS